MLKTSQTSRISQRKIISPPHFTDETKHELLKMHDDNGEAFNRSLVKIKKAYETD